MKADRIKVELSNEDRKILRDIRDALLANGAPQFTGRLVESAPPPPPDVSHIVQPLKNRASLMDY
jgi:hypothetical protein